MVLPALLTLSTLFLATTSASPLLSAQIPSRNCGASLAAIANTTSFTLKEYLVETTSSGRLRGTFTIENPAAGGDSYRLYHIPVNTGGGTWSVCQPPLDGTIPLPAQLNRCQYLIERRSKTIGFRFQWYCDAPGNTNTPYVYPAIFLCLRVIVFSLHSIFSSQSTYC